MEETHKGEGIMANELACSNCGMGFTPTCHITRQKFSSSECRVRYNNAKRYYADTPVNECPECGTPIQQSGEAGRWRQCEKEEACVPMKKSTVPSALLPGSGMYRPVCWRRSCTANMCLRCRFTDRNRSCAGSVVSRQIMSNWVLTAGERWLLPVYHVLHKELLANKILHADETTLMVLWEPERQALADELGEDGIRELAQRYAEAYEGCYDGAELDAYIEEICADAYAGMDRLPEEKARIVQQAAQRRLEAQSAEKSGETRGPPEKYSINNTRRLSWKAQVNGYFSNDGSVQSSDSLYLGESYVDGVLNAPLYIPTSVINKAVRQPKGSRSAHALTKSDIMKLESGVRNAPAVIVNPARNAVVFVTENADASGSYIIASFDLNNNLFGETAHKSTSIHGQVNLPALFENLGADATIFVKNENKLNQMLPGNQILKSLELLAKVELDDGSVAENSGNVNEKFSAAEDTEEEDARLAAEEAAKEPPTVYENLTMDSIPKKAQDYLRRVRGQTAAAIQQTLSMPFAARQEVLKPAIEEMMNEYLQTGRISQETVDRNFEESYRRGVKRPTVRVRWEFSDTP